ncbi:hypothetical protein MLD38_038629 [Melastoma candidum]|uniref:Uncharacterized protein n=1 Tax=Melastoma candidum TaxID=119954 RepID=A0ACB9L0J4_9MYRT|nr:hypothetical protein MLD38_038629 [Melastoma candidum]
MRDSPHQAYPLAPSNGYPRSDMDSLSPEEEKRKKRIKWAIYITAFSVFQVMVILVFALVIMKVRTPKFRIGDIRIQTFDTGNSASPAFNMTFIAPIRIKNANFGPYKYDASSVEFTYGGVPVGQAAIPKSKANFRSTKKLDVTVSLSSASLQSTSGLASELSTGTLTLGSQGQLDGKVEMMLIFKKKKSTQMNCTVTFNVTTKSVQDTKCN